MSDRACDPDRDRYATDIESQYQVCRRTKAANRPNVAKTGRKPARKAPPNAPLPSVSGGLAVANSAVDDTYERAVSLFNENRLDDAVDLVTADLDQRPDDGRLWELLGTLAYAKDDFELA